MPLPARIVVEYRLPWGWMQRWQAARFLPSSVGRNIGGMMPFRVNPDLFIAGEERANALASLNSYFGAFTGRKFEAYADQENPDEFTARDVLAVSMLNVTVPAAVAIWLLEDGKDAVRDSLSDIPQDARIDTHGHLLSPGSRGWQLWKCLVERKGLGRTIVSKLLAAKRPHLFPIYDQHVGAALMENPSEDYWAAWRKRFERGGEAALAPQCERLVASADVAVPRNLSALRTLDVVVWMRVHGDKGLAARERFWL